jgi:ADP-ribosylglycohydrolase
MVIHRQDDTNGQAQATPQASLARAREALEGLSCGDAFGECFFQPEYRAQAFRAARRLPPAPWRFTDDTMMAISVYASLAQHGEIEPSRLAASLALHHDTERRYGSAMSGLLQRLRAVGAENWFEEAIALFDGEGSNCSGAAMRVAPVGAYFAHNMRQVIEEATLSAICTHWHPEGVTGAVATAVATALAWQDRTSTVPMTPHLFLSQVIEHTPDGPLHKMLEEARRLPPDIEPLEAALTIGNGSRGTARDTVPFALWCAARSLGNYKEALWSAVNGGGDMDTNCAIVGGIVGTRTGIAGIPVQWLQSREPLDDVLNAVLRTSRE